MTQKWYHVLSSALRPLALDSLQLLHREQQQSTQFSNYDFVVFPLAKAYESFLKDFLFSLDLIDEATYRSKKFSIGRSLNPDVRLEQRDEWWFYDDLARLCGADVAREIWDAWLERNRLVHLYPEEIQTTTLADAESKINNFIRVISLCGVCTPSSSTAPNN
jgi:hypothetical protein